MMYVAVLPGTTGRARKHGLPLLTAAAAAILLPFCCLVATQVLVMLSEVLEPSTQLFLNPQSDLSELPLKSFYRWVT
jgi:hypothetical protein